MTTVAEAWETLRARLDESDSGIAIPLRWQGEDNGPLPDVPSAFAYVVFSNEGSGGAPAAFGGGRGQNTYRNRGFVEAFVFVPNGEGLAEALEKAETIAARFRSYREGDVSCFSADVHPLGDGADYAPPGISRNEANNYQCALVEATVIFDQIG